MPTNILHPNPNERADASWPAMNFDQLLAEVGSVRFRKYHTAAAVESASSLLTQARRDRDGGALVNLVGRISEVKHSREFFDTGEQIVLRAATHLLSAKTKAGTSMPGVVGAVHEIRRVVLERISTDSSDALSPAVGRALIPPLNAAVEEIKPKRRPKP